MEDYIGSALLVGLSKAQIMLSIDGEELTLKKYKLAKLCSSANSNKNLVTYQMLFRRNKLWLNCSVKCYTVVSLL